MFWIRVKDAICDANSRCESWGGHSVCALWMLGSREGMQSGESVMNEDFLLFASFLSWLRHSIFIA